MTYDFVILGGGPAGYTAALRAAGLEATVALVEREQLGGVCLNWGCIPTKTLLASSKLYEQMRRAADFGIRCEGMTPDLNYIVARKEKVVAQLRMALQKLLITQNIQIFEGVGSLSAPDRVEVQSVKGRQTLQAKRVILATGSRLTELPGLACDGKRILDIRSALSLDWLPQRLLVVGAGAVGCEMAQHFSGLGSLVSIVELLDKPLGGMLDADLEKMLLRTFKKRKYQLHFGTSIQSIQQGADSITAIFTSGERLDVEAVLVATGMAPDSRGLGLEALGVEMTEAGHIKVDEHCRTSVETVYAVGDVTGIQPLAHFAAHMGSIAVRHAVGEEDASIDIEAVPKVVFIEPEMAWVGLTEEQAQKRFDAVKTGSFLVRGLGRATTENRLDGIVKLVARAKDLVVVGAHILSHQADALIGEAALAVARGLTLRDLAETIHPHPAYAEGLMEAAGAAVGKRLNLEWR